MKPAARAARNLLRQEQFGVLSTLSKKLGGYPFGSIAGYLLDASACPLLFLSTLAEHTRNLEADPRVSLLAHEKAQDWQDHGRVTVIGQAVRLHGDTEALRRRYLRYFPSAAETLALPDFFFYRITPEKIRFIGGFGDIHWVAPGDFLLPPSPLAGQEEALLAEFNRAGGATLRDWCAQVRQQPVYVVEMVGIDADGFDLRADGVLQRFDFAAPVQDGAAAHAALTAMLKEAP